MTTLSIEDRALRMLAAGDSHTDISSATGLSRDEIARLQRDFPGTHTQQPRPPAVPQRVGTATPIAGVPNPALSRAIDAAGVTAPVSLVTSSPAPEPAALTVVPASADAAIPYAALLNTARSHSVARVRNLADRIGKQLHDLEALIAEHQAAESARRAEQAAKAKARAEVACLEQQLAAAKAKLRGKATTTRPAAAPSTGEYVCSKGCGKVLNTPQGRGNHDKHCTGTAS